jgi:hypothetical protein
MSLDSIAEALEKSLELVYSIDWSADIQERLYGPPGHPTLASIGDAYEALAGQPSGPLPACLIPLMVVDERSLACVAVDSDPDVGIVLGEVVRWHLDVVPPHLQALLLDVDPLLYVKSVEEELEARGPGLDRVLDEIGPAYERSHLDKEKRPRDFVVRPVRIACQNVIVALGAIAQDSTFDGLSVPAWQTCEVPHVATHEANRALAALTLCDAFQNGGTMEIRFDRRARIVHEGRPLDYDGHPEMRVPASLRRFGRTVGVVLGGDAPATITPREARDLFLAITPMPGTLRARVDDAVQHRGIAPERLCFLLLSQVWREIEMDYLLAVSSRAASILAGGARWTERLARQAESEVCRGAVTAGMLYRRLNSTDAAAAGSALRVVEDRDKGIGWEIHPGDAAVSLAGLALTDRVPWTSGLTGVETLTVFPRTSITADVVSQVADADVPGNRAFLVPADVPTPMSGLPFPVLRCPDRLADIDKNIEERLLTSRISRG